MIEILIILTFAMLFIINVGIFKDDNGVRDAGLILFGVIAFFGWGLIGVFIPINDYELKIDAHIKYNANTIEASIDSTQEVFLFDKKLDFDNLDDTTTLFLNLSNNIYGVNQNTYVYYVIKGKKFKSEIKQ
jgi:hypothetical protein